MTSSVRIPAVLAGALVGMHGYTLVRNRRHTNVASVPGELLRYEPEEDTLGVVPGIATGYPNLVFDVPAGKLDRFVEALSHAGAGERDRLVGDVVEGRGVRRTDPDLWSVYHDIYRCQVETAPLEAEWLDLNRYIDS